VKFEWRSTFPGTNLDENCPILSPDGKFLFYTSGGDIYWVSAAIIDEVKRS